MGQERKRLKIGVAFSGGVSKCAYQVGFLKAFLRYVDTSEIKLISGSSMGLLTAYVLSAGKLAHLEWMYRKIDIKRPVELFWQAVVKDLFSHSLDEFFSVYDELKIPLCFPVCYVPLFATRYYWLKGEYNPMWKSYIKAATNFSTLKVTPVVHKGRLAFDGGAVDNIPIFPLIKHTRAFSEAQELDLIIALHFDARYDYRKDFSTNVPVLDIDVSICNLFKKNHFNFDSEYVNEMIENAENYAENIC